MNETKKQQKMLNIRTTIETAKRPKQHSKSTAKQSNTNIISDSQYAINCINSWKKKWEYNKFRKSKNKNLEIENIELIQDILKSMNEFKEKGITKPFDNNFHYWKYEPLIEAKRIAGILNPLILK